jgi:hypothetical protein
MRVREMSLRKKIVLGLGAAALLAGVVYACFCAFFFAALWIGGGTTYAPGYSEKAFKQVRKGMTQAEVLKLVGEPLQKRPVERRTWGDSVPPQGWPDFPEDWVEGKPDKGANTVFYYTKPDQSGNGSYHERCVAFDRSGRVYAVVSERWFD